MSTQLAEAPFLQIRWIASRHESRAALLRPVNASELLDSIASLGESRESGATGNGVVRADSSAESSTHRYRRQRSVRSARHGANDTGGRRLHS